jgi:hypothetical protein
MKRFRYGPLSALIGAVAVSGLGMGVSGCGVAQARETPVEVDVDQEALDLPGALGDLAKQCGLVCPEKGLVAGNASISGLPSIDGFFGSVLKFQDSAKGAAAGIDAELSAIRADFELPADADIGAALKAKLDANLEAGFQLKVEPPQCKADFKAELQAAARCDATVDPGKVKVECKGGCDVQASAKVMCDASADLKCTFSAPEVECKGECTGTCTVDVNADVGCQGTCEGSCDGECSAYVKDGSGAAKCAGKCSGKCTGKCRAEVTADASCKGTCSGECSYTPPEANCEGAVKAQCKAKANASIMCDTKCDGDFEPPSVKAECQAKVHADAKLNVQCTPPHVAFNYKLKASIAGDIKARVKFEAALKALIDVRLPALKAALKRSDLVVSAGADLSAAAGGALKSAVNTAQANAGVRVKVGLGCALLALPDVSKVVDGSTANLKRSVDAAGKINAALSI